MPAPGCLVGVVLFVSLTACGSGTNRAKPPDNTAASTRPRDTSLGTGVTDTTVKVGVALIDFDCIKQFTDNIRTDQVSYYQAFADDINEHGGVAGRKIQLDVHESCPHLSW